MSRSSKKGPFVDLNILKKIANIKPGNPTPIKTWARGSEISPEMVGYRFGVHNGKNFIEVLIKEEMVGHRLGEFAFTKKFVKHGGKMQRELEASQAQAAAQKTAAAAAPAVGKK